MMMNYLKKGFMALLILIVFTLFLTACKGPDIPACIPTFEESDCPVVNCPFDMCFGEAYVKQAFVTGKVQVIGISSDACDELFVKKYGEHTHLCKLLQAEQIYKVGNSPNGELWEWSIDCECSYEK